MPKGAVAVLPPDLMAEAHARVKERERKNTEHSLKEDSQVCAVRSDAEKIKKIVSAMLI